MIITVYSIVVWPAAFLKTVITVKAMNLIFAIVSQMRVGVLW